MRHNPITHAQDEQKFRAAIGLEKRQSRCLIQEDERAKIHAVKSAANEIQEKAATLVTAAEQKDLTAVGAVKEAVNKAYEQAQVHGLTTPGDQRADGDVTRTYRIVMAKIYMTIIQCAPATAEGFKIAVAAFRDATKLASDHRHVDEPTTGLCFCDAVAREMWRVEKEFEEKIETIKIQTEAAVPASNKTPETARASGAPEGPAFVDPSGSSSAEPLGASRSSLKFNEWKAGAPETEEGSYARANQAEATAKEAIKAVEAAYKEVWSAGIFSVDFVSRCYIPVITNIEVCRITMTLPTEEGFDLALKAYYEEAKRTQKAYTAFCEAVKKRVQYICTKESSNAEQLDRVRKSIANDPQIVKLVDEEKQRQCKKLQEQQQASNERVLTRVQNFGPTSTPRHVRVSGSVAHDTQPQGSMNYRR